MTRLQQEREERKVNLTIAEKLLARLNALGCEVSLPKRIWVGSAWDNPDLWRWQAAYRISKSSFIGSAVSMQRCLKMSDDELRLSIESGQTGRNVFYPDWDTFSAASKKLKGK